MMHNATQSNTTITTHCTTSTELLLSGTDDSSVTRRTSFKLQQCCHYFVSNPCIISKLFLFFNINSLKTNTFIPAMLQRHYPVPVVVLREICKIPLYSCNRLLVRRTTLTSEEEFQFWEDTEVRGTQIWGIGWMFQQFIVQIP